MKNIEELYILGLPVETEAGVAYPLRVADYAEYIQDLYILSFTKNYIIYQYMKLNDSHKLDELINELSRLKLMDIAMGLPELKQSYINIFNKTFGNDSYIHSINENNFEDIRETILKINCSKEEDAFLNVEIQNAIERSKRVKNRESDDLDFSDILSSIVTYTGIDYSVIKDWTLYQVYATYSRIAQFKNYDTSTLFATVAEKVKVDSWSKHIDLFQKDHHAMSVKDFDKQYGGMFK